MHEYKTIATNVEIVHRLFVFSENMAHKANNAKHEHSTMIISENVFFFIDANPSYAMTANGKMTKKACRFGTKV